MTAKLFVDTNVLIYAYDVDAGDRHRIANQLVADLWRSRRGVLSSQVLQEFYVNVTRKISVPLTRSEARRLIRLYGAWPVITVDADAIAKASEVEEQFQLSFWDALIITAAVRSGATTLLTEDLSHDQRIAGVRIVNPFATGLDLGTLVADTA